MTNDSLYNKILSDGILKKHNIGPYLKVRKSFETSNKVGIIHATGTGKSFIALQLMNDNPDKKFIYLVPKLGIGDQIEEYISNLGYEDKEKFKNVKIMTYQSLINMSPLELQELELDYLITDEFHHLAGKIWGSRVDLLVKTHPDLKILGMTATPINSRGTSQERDMADEFFEGNIASFYPINQAIADGVLKRKIVYKGACYQWGEKIEQTSKQVLKSNLPLEEKRELLNKLEMSKRKVTEALSFSEILKNYLKPNGKYIVFCPRTKLEETIQNSYDWLSGITDSENIVRYYMTSKEISKSREQSRLFYNDQDDTKLRVMFVMDMYNEGIHVPDLDGVIMLRPSKSDIVFYQQLGRALASGDDSRETLILDMVNNYDYIRHLEQKIKSDLEINRLFVGESTHYDSDFLFDIELINLDIYNLLSEINNKIYISYDKKMEEFIELLNSGYIPIARDCDTVFSNGEYACNFWLRYKEKIQNELFSNERYAVGYDTAKKIVKDKLIDKVSEYIELLNAGYIPKYRDSKTKFSNGEFVNQFWHPNQEKIKERLKMDPKYATGYETAKTIVREVEQKTKHRDKSIPKVDKVAEYIELLNTGYKPKYRDSKTKFSNGEPINQFWHPNQEKIKERLKMDPKYATGYETAKTIVREVEQKTKHRDKSIPKVDKVSEYIELLNEGYIPYSYDPNQCFSNGESINYFWGDRKDIIIKRLKSDSKYQIGYDTAKKNIYDYLNPIDKVSEYIDLLNHGYIPKTIETEVKFSNGDLINKFWHNNREKIIEKLNNDSKYKNGYETAKSIMQEIIKNAKFKDKSIPKVDKVSEYIELLNTGYSPKTKDTTNHFSNGEAINFFWVSSKNKVVEALNTDSKYESGYEVAKKMIADKLFDKISEYIELLNTGYIPCQFESDKTFSNGVQIGYFWPNNKNKIKERINTDPKYEKGYDVAKRIILEKENPFDKIADYIELLNNGYIPSSYDPDQKFSNGESVNYFWSANDNKAKIIERLNTDSKYQEGYEIAMKIIQFKNLNVSEQKKTLQEFRKGLIEIENKGRKK